MDTNAYATLYRTVQDKLTASSQSDHGRTGRHSFGPCPVCRVHVCLTHHTHESKDPSHV